MHEHGNEDELFMVGILFIELEERTLKVSAGEFVIIPKGTKHRPFAPEEVHLLLFEPEATINTGNETSQLTRNHLEDL